MPNRREFLAMSLASSALPVLAGEQRQGAPYLEDSNTECERSGAVIVEMTSPLALAFRAEALKTGLPAHGIHDDITDLWYHHLDRLFVFEDMPGCLSEKTWLCAGTRRDPHFRLLS